MITLRLLQGLSVGGEYTTSIVYAVEPVPPHRRGLIGGLIGGGAICGILLGSAAGTAVNAMLSGAEVAAWGWRVPFLFGILVGGIGLVLRRSLPEAGPVPDAGGSAPIVAAFREAWVGVLQIIGLSALNGAGFYLLFVYSVTYLHASLSVPTRQALDINTASMVLLLTMMPVGAALSDRIGRKPVLTASAGATAPLGWHLFRLLQRLLARLQPQLGRVRRHGPDGGHLLDRAHAQRHGARLPADGGRGSGLGCHPHAAGDLPRAAEVMLVHAIRRS